MSCIRAAGIRLLDVPAGTPPPGPVVGGLVFKIGAQPFGEEPLTALPIDVNLSARYTDAELGSRDESRLTMSWYDPSAGQWKPAPKLAADPRNNYISATIQALGLYAVHQAP